MSISPRSGASMLQRFPYLKNNKVQKWESGFALGLDATKNTHYIQKCWKSVKWPLAIGGHLLGYGVHLWRHLSMVCDLEGGADGAQSVLAAMDRVRPITTKLFWHDTGRIIVRI